MGTPYRKACARVYRNKSVLITFVKIEMVCHFQNSMDPMDSMGFSGFLERKCIGERPNSVSKRCLKRGQNGPFWGPFWGPK